MYGGFGKEVDRLFALAATTCDHPKHSATPMDKMSESWWHSIPGEFVFYKTLKETVHPKFPQRVWSAAPVWYGV